jgi:hypothetical protein
VKKLTKKEIYMFKNDKILAFAAFIAACLLSSCSVEDILDKDKSSSSEEQGEHGVSSDDSQLSSSSEQPSSSSETPPPPPSSSSVAPSSSSAVQSSSSNVVRSGSSYFVITGGSLWGPNTEEFPSLQVRVPDVIACWSENPYISEHNPCFGIRAGWWYGYKYAGGFVEVRKEGSFVEFSEGVSLTDFNDGASLIDSYGLRVRLTAQSENGTLYGGAGIGFNFGGSKTKTQDINSKGGYCITYSSDGPIIFKLGHNETIYDDACTFQFTLPPNSSPTAVSFTWDQFTLPTGCANTMLSIPIVTKETALTQAVGVKLEIPSSQSQTPTVVNFILHRLGWLNDGCSVQQ